MGLGLSCAVGGLFLAAGFFKDTVWPKVLAIGGIVLLVVGLPAKAA